MPTFVALYTGSPQNGPPPDMDEATIRKGMQAWMAWGETHADSIVEQGGPLGRTKRVSRSGVEDIRNNVAGYVVVEAESHEAAAKMFEDHPHFTIFPGDAVEVMPLLPIPKMP